MITKSQLEEYKNQAIIINEQSSLRNELDEIKGKSAELSLMVDELNKDKLSLIKQLNLAKEGVEKLNKEIDLNKTAVKNLSECKTEKNKCVSQKKSLNDKITKLGIYNDKLVADINQAKEKRSHNYKIYKNQLEEIDSLKKKVDYLRGPKKFNPPLKVINHKYVRETSLTELFDGALTLTAYDIDDSEVCLKTNLASRCESLRVGEYLNINLYENKYSIRIDGTDGYDTSYISVYLVESGEL